MSIPLGDGGKPIEFGDPSYIYDGIYNPIIWVNKEPYRPRVETLVVRDRNKIFLRTYDKMKSGMWYTIPGGSIDADSTKAEQARNETNEEALVEVKDLYYTGIQYYARYKPGFVRGGGDSPIEYAGTINDVFVASYAGPYDKSKVEPKDLDLDIADNGKFYPIKSVLTKLIPEHIRALQDSPLVDLYTKKEIGLFVANNYEKVTESMNPDFPAVLPPGDFMYHGSKHRFDVFHPMSIDFGNAQQKPGWSTFAFGEFVLALRFGLMRTIQDELSGKDFDKCQWNFKLNKPYIYRHMFSKIRPKILGLKFYVYHIKTEGLDIGIGNDVRFQEYTFREDNVRPYMVQTITIDDVILKDHLECMDLITAGHYEKEELPKFNYYKERHHAAFINHDYENDPKIQKLLQAISEKRLQPGDDVEKFMIDNDLVPDDLDWKVPVSESMGNVGMTILTTKRLLEYKKKYPHSMIRHVRTPNDVNQGRALETKSKLLVGYVMVDTERHMITALEVEKSYRGMGFGKKLLDIAINELGAKYLTVNKKNTPAISLYKKYGWKVYKETDTMLFMSAPGVTFLMEGYQFQPSEVSAMVPVIESRLTAADRSSLSDKDFGIPEEKKYPMPDEKHVLSAIQYFNKVEPKYEKTLVKNILRKMYEFGMDNIHVSPDNRFSKYVPKGMVQESFVDIDEIPLEYGEPSHGVPEDKSIPNGIPEYKKYVVNRYKHEGEYLGLLDWEKSIDEYIKKKNYGLGLYYVYGSNQGYPEYAGMIIVRDDHTWHPYITELSSVEEGILPKKSSLFTETLVYVRTNPEKVLHMIVDELKTWDYGYVIKGRTKMFSSDGVAITNVQHDPYFVENYRTLSVADFERYKCGTCFDYTNYIYYLLVQLFKIHDDYDITCYYIEGEDGNDHPCHVFPIVRLRSTGRYYYMETAWKSDTGVFVSEGRDKKKLLKSIVSKWLKSNRLSEYVVLCEYVPSGHLVGVDCFTFMTTVNRNTNIKL